MAQKLPFHIICKAMLIFLLLNAPYVQAESNQTASHSEESDDIVDFKNFLSGLDKTKTDSVLVARDEFLSRFQGKSEANRDKGFRTFSSFYYNTIRQSDPSFSSNNEYQMLLGQIENATKEYFDPFPVFEKLDTAEARAIKEKYSQTYTKLMEYRKAGMNFSSSEGTWYLRGDGYFLVEVSKITGSEMQAYAKFNAAEWEKTIVDDAALLISWEDLRKRILRWEEFAQKHPQMPEVASDIKPHLNRIVALYLTGIDNTSVFAPGKDEIGRLDHKLQQSYELFLQDSATSSYAELIRGVYELWKKNDFKVSAELVSYLEIHGFGDYLFRFKQILKEQTTGSAPVPARFEDTVGSQVVVVLLAFIGFIGFIGLLLYLRRKLRKAT